MNNQEHAAQVLLKHWSVAQETGQDDECDCCAQALANAGLLLPDLPEPEVVEEGKPYWYSSTYGIAVGQLTPSGRQDVLFWDSEPGGVAYMGVEGAREFAYALLAAAKLAEEQE